MISVHTVRTWSLVFLFSGIVVFAIGIVAYERPLSALAFAVQASLLAFVTTEAFGPIAARRPRTIRILARVYVGAAVVVLLIFLRSWLT